MQIIDKIKNHLSLKMDHKHSMLWKYIIYIDKYLSQFDWMMMLIVKIINNNKMDVSHLMRFSVIIRLTLITIFNH